MQTMLEVERSGVALTVAVVNLAYQICSALSLYLQAAVAFYQQAPSKLFDMNCHEHFDGWDML